MPRVARELSPTGIYHVMLRGADRRILFSDDQDCLYFLKMLLQAKELTGCKIYAYCLMGNHVHLLIQEGTEPLYATFKSLGVSYVAYYNGKYQLQGHLFQDRYRSEPVASDAYFLDVLRYICQNPVKAGLCEQCTEYRWLGCGKLMGNDSILDDFNSYTNLSRDTLMEFVSKPCAHAHIDEDDKKRLTDQEAIERLLKTCNCTTVQEIGGWDNARQKVAIRQALDAGVSIRQLSRLTGISKTFIERAKSPK